MCYQKNLLLICDIIYNNSCWHQITEQTYFEKNIIFPFMLMPLFLTNVIILTHKIHLQYTVNFIHYKKKVLTVMADNATKCNINKITNNRWAQKRPQHMALEIYVLTLDRHKNVVGLNWSMESHLSLYFYPWTMYDKINLLTSDGKYQL